MYLTSCSKCLKPGPVASAMSKVALSCKGWLVFPGPCSRGLPTLGMQLQKDFCTSELRVPQPPHAKVWLSPVCKQGNDDPERISSQSKLQRGRSMIGPGCGLSPGRTSPQSWDFFRSTWAGTSSRLCLSPYLVLKSKESLCAMLLEGLK